jgi:hypothetical protein
MRPVHPHARELRLRQRIVGDFAVEDGRFPAYAIALSNAACINSKHAPQSAADAGEPAW